MTDVEYFIDRHDGDQRAVMRYMHHLLSVDFGLVAKIRYGIPFYYRKSWICYLNPVKGGGVELAFTRGNELSNEQGLLEDRGRKQVSGVVFSGIREIQERTVQEIVQEALLLDDVVPYASKRKKMRG